MKITVTINKNKIKKMGLSKGVWLAGWSLCRELLDII